MTNKSHHPKKHIDQELAHNVLIAILIGSSMILTLALIGVIYNLSQVRIANKELLQMMRQNQEHNKQLREILRTEE